MEWSRSGAPTRVPPPPSPLFQPPSQSSLGLGWARGGAPARSHHLSCPSSHQTPPLASARMDGLSRVLRIMPVYGTAMRRMATSFLKLASSTGWGGASATSEPSACRMRGTLMVCGPAPYSASRWLACMSMAMTYRAPRARREEERSFGGRAVAAGREEGGGGRLEVWKATGRPTSGRRAVDGRLTGHAPKTKKKLTHHHLVLPRIRRVPGRTARRCRHRPGLPASRGHASAGGGCSRTWGLAGGGRGWMMGWGKVGEAPGGRRGGRRWEAPRLGPHSNSNPTRPPQPARRRPPRSGQGRDFYSPLTCMCWNVGRWYVS